MQQYADIYFTAKSLYMFRVSQYPSSGVLKTVTAASGTGLDTGTATSLQRGLIGTDQYADIYFTAKSLYMFRVSQHPSSGVLKTVTAASGTGHNTGTDTSLQRGPIGRLFARFSLRRFGLRSLTDPCGDS